MAQEATRLRRAALHLDQAHAAIAGDRQALVVAEARNLGAGRFAAWSSVNSAGTSISLPSTMIFAMSLLRRFHDRWPAQPHSGCTRTSASG